LAGREKVDTKDYITLFLAFIQTIFLPLIVFMVVLILIVLLLSLIRPVEEIILVNVLQVFQNI